MSSVEIRKVDYLNDRDAQALRQMMQCYATDLMGGGQAIDEQLLQLLPEAMHQQAGAVSFIAWVDQRAVALINAFPGFSTFAVKPLLNIHDIIVHPEFRGQGIAKQLLAAVEGHARDLYCCKLTLEVLSENTTAKKAYSNFGFVVYQLDPDQGHAEFWQKKLD